MENNNKDEDLKEGLEYINLINKYIDETKKKDNKEDCQNTKIKVIIEEGDIDQTKEKLREFIIVISKYLLESLENYTYDSIEFKQILIDVLTSLSDYRDDAKLDCEISTYFFFDKDRYYINSIVTNNISISQWIDVSSVMTFKFIIHQKYLQIACIISSIDIIWKIKENDGFILNDDKSSLSYVKINKKQERILIKEENILEKYNQNRCINIEILKNNNKLDKIRSYLRNMLIQKNLIDSKHIDYSIGCCYIKQFKSAFSYPCQNCENKDYKEILRICFIEIYHKCRVHLCIECYKFYNSIKTDLSCITCNKYIVNYSKIKKLYYK